MALPLDPPLSPFLGFKEMREGHGYVMGRVWWREQGKPVKGGYRRAILRCPPTS